MRKNHYLQLAVVFSFSLIPEISMAESATPPSNSSIGSSINPYNLCQNGDIDVFSCDLKSGKKVSLCANNNPTRLVLSIKNTNGKVIKHNIEQAKQIINAADQGGSTIIKNGHDNSVGLYLDVHSGEGGYSVITVSGNKNEVCDNDTVEANVDQLGVDSDKLDLWNLIKLKVTSDFDLSGNHVDQSKQLRQIWRSWPRP